ncbi:MAG TPA: BTAD domain-containing putative transcriptional regulator [Streptosporangiaceae bacterium]|nr:BTAD domain-containing putative transcriptional regulator [Streptosporangiaceae bacterium]
MRFNILGPLEIRADDGAAVTVTRRLHRSMLALLLLDACQPRSAACLIAAVWGEDPPLNPEVSLRSCIYGIRKLLPDAQRLCTHPAGYLFQVRPGELDLHEFRDLSSRGRDALDRGDPREAMTLLAAALGLWGEPPVADLPEVRGKDQLIEQRAEAQSALLDAKLALGLHHQVLAECRSIVTAEPVREHSWAQLITALYRCGSRVEALAAFGRLRMTLVSGYGIEPGPELQELHRQILADDPALMVTRQALPATRLTAAAAAARPLIARPAEAPANVLSAEPGSWRSASQLPASVADFTGRAAELSRLLGRLSADGMTVTVLRGMPGAGKTELAIRAAHLARPCFPDGQLCAWLDDGGQARDPQVVLGELLRGLGVPPGEIPASRFEREAMYRSVLARCRVLLLADGASSAAQVRPLLPSSEGSAVIVTSRGRLADLDGARFIELGGMLPADSVSLLVRICDRRLSGADFESAMSIAAACGHLPLAVRIAGARLADDPGLTLAGLAGALTDQSRRLDELTLGESSVRARIAAAAQAVSAAARTALVVLAAAGPRDAPEWLITSLLDDPVARQHARSLANAGLLQRVTGAGQADGITYRMHPLVRDYAGELLASTDPGVVGSATGRLLASGWLELANGGLSRESARTA